MRRLWVSILLIPLVLSCGSDNPTGPESLAGAYDLQSVTGSFGGTTLTLTPPDITGFLTLTVRGRYSLGFDSELAELDVVDAGTFTTSGSTIALVSDVPDDEAAVTGEVSPDRSTITLTAMFEDEGDLVSLTIVFGK